MQSTAIESAAALLRADHGTDRAFGECDSVSLRLEKFVRLGDNSRKEEIASVVSKSAQSVPEFSPARSDSFVATLGGRLIVNQAGGILENAGLCLHPHFNAPYIPGSALKGVARHAAWCSWREADSAKKAEIAETIADVFGYPTGDAKPTGKKADSDDSSRDYLDDYLLRLYRDRVQDEKAVRPAHSGTVAFMAAMPDGTARLVVDIVNCHHPKYYSGDTKFQDAPDTELPNPQFFPAVEKDQKFVFTLVPLRPDADLAAARSWLITALTENGVGAKTAAGYGWFEYSDEVNEKWQTARAAKYKAERIRRETEGRVAECLDRLAKFENACGDMLTPDECRTLDEIERVGKDLNATIEGGSLRRQCEDINVRCRKLDAKRPHLSLEEQVLQAWAGRSVREQILTPYIQTFDKRDAATQAAVVKILRTHDLWKYLRAGNFTDLKKKTLIKTVND